MNLTLNQLSILYQLHKERDQATESSMKILEEKGLVCRRLVANGHYWDLTQDGLDQLEMILLIESEQSL